SQNGSWLLVDAPSVTYAPLLPEERSLARLIRPGKTVIGEFVENGKKRAPRVSVNVAGIKSGAGGRTCKARLRTQNGRGPAGGLQGQATGGRKTV
ncbi:MAG: hypothetical protein IT186_11675, partial [Acidobacteria bacterium]|nr:hypothetical protein [Acidobacteriota bacterium]